jgi:hypothetical protein
MEELNDNRRLLEWRFGVDLNLNPRTTDLSFLVGAARFELATPCAQGRCATRLRYAPILFLYHEEEIGDKDNVEMRPEPRRVQGSHALNVVHGGIRNGQKAGCGVQPIKLALRTLRVLQKAKTLLSPASLEAAENAEKEKGYLESK